MTILIRPALPADATDMAEIHVRSWEAAYKDIVPADYMDKMKATGPGKWQKILSEGKYPQMIILQNGKTVGIMCVAAPGDDDLDDRVYELYGLYLHPDYYRQGIGTRAMEYAYDMARGKGKTAMTLWVFAENLNAIKFYEKCGFIPDGKRKTLNCGRSMVAVRMGKHL